MGPLKCTYVSTPKKYSGISREGKFVRISEGFELSREIAIAKYAVIIAR